MILMGIPRRRQHLPPPTPTPPLRQHRHLHRAYAPPPNHRPCRIPILPPPQHLRHPRALLIAAGALTLVALAVVLGPTVGLPLGLLVPESFAEYCYGPPPPPPPPPPSSDVHPPPQSHPASSSDAHTDDSDAALAALHAPDPPPSPLRARATPSKHRASRHAASTPSTPSPARPSAGPSKRGPPKGSIDTTEARLHQTEALVGILLAAAAGAGGVWRDLARHMSPSPAPSSPASTTARTHGNNGSAHNTPPPTPVSVHPSTEVPGAINAGPGGMNIGSTPSLALVPSFLPPILLLCGGGVPRRGGRGGGASERARWRDRGGVLALRPAQGPHTSSAHIVVAPPHSTPACPACDGRPRLRAPRAVYTLSLPGCACIIVRRRARARFRAALCICAPAAPLSLRSAHHCSCLSPSSYTRGMHSPSHSHSAHPRTSYICMYMYHISVHANAQYTLFPFPSVRVSESRPSPSRVVRGPRMKVYLRGAESCASEGINTDPDTEARESWKWTRARNEKAGKEKLG
ncbi:hypothetical protein DFH09DRAFT_1409211 [Mycena vulgaris]|nr:hypothetical protein DFH09DRAFT_1409211 [Mycena vulgaris]